MHLEEVGGAQRLPKLCFRLRWLMPYCVCANFEECLAFELLTLFEHFSPAPSEAAGLRPYSRRICDTREP